MKNKFVYLLILVGLAMMGVGIYLTLTEKPEDIIKETGAVTENITIKEEKIYSSDNIEINSISLKQDSNEYKIKYSIKNKTEKEVSATFNLAVNDRLTSLTSSISNLKAGETKEVEMKILEENLDEIEVKKLISLILICNVVSQDGKVLEQREVMPINTNHQKVMKQNQSIGEEIYDDDYISVQYMNFTKGENGKIHLNLFIENKGTEIVNLRLGNNNTIVVDGDPYKGEFETVIDPGIYRFASVTFQSDVQPNDIQTANFSLAFYNTETKTTTLETKTFSIS